MGRFSGWAMYGGLSLALFFIVTHGATSGWDIGAEPWRAPTLSEAMIGVGAVVAFWLLSSAYGRVRGPRGDE